MISRERAREIAEEASPWPVSKVLAWDEIQWRRPCLYEMDLTGCWVAYLDRGGMQIRASEIVAVGREDGAIVYQGSASDEG